MAVLDETNRARTAAQGMRWADMGPLVGLTKADWRAAVNACDDWADANAAEFNLALPQPARGALTAAQKALLLCLVVMRRAGRLRAEED